MKYKQFRLMANSHHFFFFQTDRKQYERVYRSQMYYISITSEGIPRTKRKDT